MILPWWDDDWWGRPRRRPLFEALSDEQVAAYRIEYGGYEDEPGGRETEPEPRPLDVVAAAVEIAGRAWGESAESGT